jgi:hypothetical protein
MTTIINKISAAIKWVFNIRVRNKNTIYLAIRNDGKVGTGTVGNPYNADTPQLFDSYISGAAAGNTIYLGSGVFQTHGYRQATVGGSYVKTGWKVIGQGIDKTIIKLVEATAYGGPHWCFGTDYDQFAHNTTWKDFTLDCNLDGQIDKTGICIGGMALGGNNILYKNIKVINWGARIPEQECFVLSAGGTDSIAPSNLTGATIDSCIVTQRAPNAEMNSTSLIFCGGAEDDVSDTKCAHINPVIRNCYCDGGSLFTSQGLMAIGKNCLVENNYITNMGSSFYTDTTRLASITVRNNQFINVQKGIHFNLFTTTSTLGTGYFLNNTIELSPYIKTNEVNAFRFIGRSPDIQTSPPYTISYVVISGNKVKYYGNDNHKSEVPAYLASFHNVGTGLVIDNTSALYNDDDASFHQQIFIQEKYCGKITLINNYSSIAPLITGFIP